MSLTVDRLQSFADALTPWETVLASDPHATFFSTPAWLQTWWKHKGAGREPLFLQVRDGDRVVGFGAFVVDAVPVGQAVLFLGSGLSDYADVLAVEGADRRSVVFAVLDYLAGGFGQALFDLQEIPETSPSLPFVRQWLSGRQARWAESVQDVCPIVALPTVAEAYHKELKKSFLADVRRGERRLRERGEVLIVDHVRPEDGDWQALKEQMSDLQSQRMRTKGEIPLWRGPLGDFVKDVLAATDAAGKLRVTGVYLDGRMIAYELCFLHNRTIYAWSRAFDEEHRNTGPGKIALLHLLETGIGQGYRTFDLLRGEEPYKDLWTNGQVRNSRVMFVLQPSLGAWVAFKYRTDWRVRLQRSSLLRRLNRALKSLRGG